MASVFDVAAYLIERHGPMTAIRLQKLVYYSQAWSIVWDSKAIFPERVMDWKDGPVIDALCDSRDGKIRFDAIAAGDSERLNDSERQIVDLVLTLCANESPDFLSALTPPGGLMARRVS